MKYLLYAVGLLALSLFCIAVPFLATASPLVAHPVIFAAVVVVAGIVAFRLVVLFVTNPAARAYVRASSRVVFFKILGLPVSLSWQFRRVGGARLFCQS